MNYSDVLNNYFWSILSHGFVKTHIKNCTWLNEIFSLINKLLLCFQKEICFKNIKLHIIHKLV